MADFSIPSPFSVNVPIPSTPPALTAPVVDPEAERKARAADILGTIPRAPGAPAVAPNATLSTIAPNPDAAAFPFAPRTKNEFNLPAPTIPLPTAASQATATAAPATGLAAEPLGNYPGGTAQGAGAEQQPPQPELGTAQDTKQTRTIKLADDDETRLNEAIKAQTKTRENLISIAKFASGIADPKDPNATPEMLEQAGKINEYMGKVAATSMTVEEMINPDSDAARIFRGNVEKARAKLDAANEDLINFQKEARIDPKRYMKEMPGTERALNAMLVFMEGMAAAKAAGKGVAVPPVGLFESQINKAIEQDIQFQKQELESKKEGMANSVNRYKENLALLGNDRAAEIKTKLDYLSSINNTLNQLKQSAQGRLDVANLEEKIASNKIAIAQAKAELTKGVVDSTIIKKAAVAAPTGMSDEEFKRQESVSKAYTAATEKAVEKFDKARDFKRTLEAAKTGDEAALGVLKGMFVKDAQGGTGTISDNDIKVFGYTQEILASLKARIMANFKGTLPESVFKDLGDYAQRAEESATTTISRSVGDALIKAKQVGLRPEHLKSVVPESHFSIFSNAQKKTEKPNK